MAADPRYTWVLIGLGITELSMHPSAIPVIKNIIRASSSEEMKALAERALQAQSGKQAEELVFTAMHARFPEHLLHGGGQGVGGGDPSA